MSEIGFVLVVGGIFAAFAWNPLVLIVTAFGLVMIAEELRERRGPYLNSRHRAWHKSKRY